MSLTDEQLLLLEQLTYLDVSVAAAAGVSLVENAANVAEMLSVFDEEALTRLAAQGTIYFVDTDGNTTTTSTYAQGNEWAAIIRALQQDEALSSLQIVDSYTDEDTGRVFAYCFASEEESSEAVVAFRGTVDGDEWVDNVEGSNCADTAAQQTALAFVEGLPYSDITVVGHSKGGNKAQYVTILSDKVTRCVAMDSQGFSQEFLDKYWAQIEEKAGLICNYSLSGDYVHILLYQLPGITSYYVNGDGVEGFLENHSSTSFFQYTTDEDGNSVLLLTDDGLPALELSAESTGMTVLHGLISYVFYVMAEDTKETFLPYLGNLLKLALSRESVTVDGVEYTKDNVFAYVCTQPKSLAILLSCISFYVSEAMLPDVLSALGLESMSSLVKLLSVNAGEAVIRLASFLSGLAGSSFDPEVFGIYLARCYEAISATNAVRTGGTLRGDVVRDFTLETYEEILAAMHRMEESAFCDLSAWSAYSSEDWYGGLCISLTRKAITSYAEKLTDINTSCKSQVKTIFSDVWSLDRTTAKLLKEKKEEIFTATTTLQALAEALL